MLLGHRIKRLKANQPRSQEWRSRECFPVMTEKEKTSESEVKDFLTKIILMKKKRKRKRRKRKKKWKKKKAKARKKQRRCILSCRVAERVVMRELIYKINISGMCGNNSQVNVLWCNLHSARDAIILANKQT